MRPKEKLNQESPRIGPFSFITGARFIIFLAIALILAVGFGLHHLLFQLIHKSDSGILLHDSGTPSMATAALLMALTFGLPLALNAFLTPPTSTFRKKNPGTYWRQQIVMASLVGLFLALYAWCLRPHILVYPDRLEKTSFTSNKTLDFASIKQVIIISSLNKGSRFYRLKFMQQDNKNIYVSLSPSSIATVLVHLPKDIACQTANTPENRSLVKPLREAFTKAQEVKGRQIPAACLAAISL